MSWIDSTNGAKWSKGSMLRKIFVNDSINSLKFLSSKVTNCVEAESQALFVFDISSKRTLNEQKQLCTTIQDVSYAVRTIWACELLQRVVKPATIIDFIGNILNISCHLQGQLASLLSAAEFGAAEQLNTQLKGGPARWPYVGLACPNTLSKFNLL